MPKAMTRDKSGKTVEKIKAMNTSPDDRLRQLEDQQLASLKWRGKQEINFRRAEIKGPFSRRRENEHQADARADQSGDTARPDLKTVPPAGWA